MADAKRPEPERKSTFRADLEGLRAVAVVLVLLYHARIPGFTGGYVGVDVFFVLSGFLITGILLRERGTTGRISLSNFYARRARRILPASALVLVVTVVAAALFMPPLTLPDTTKDAAAAALYVSNMRFGLQATDYLASQASASPILHYWSLGVEEQFYVFWPALVLLVCSRGGSVARRIGITALVVSLVSLVGCVWLTGVDAPWAFFLLPTRAWELGIGAMLAVSGSWLMRIPSRAAAALGWAGLVAVAVSGMILSDETPFPGTAALLPTLGAALVIAAGFGPSFVLAPARLLGTAIPRYIGRISYSLYLWHWPLLVIPAAAAGAPLPMRERVALVGVAFVLAAISQRYVEDPIRHGRFVGTRPSRNLAIAGALSVTVALTSLGLAAASAPGQAAAPSSALAGDEATVAQIIDSALAATSGGSSSGGLPKTVDRPVPEALRPSLSAVKNDVAKPYRDGCHVDELSVDSPSCVYGDASGAHSIVLFGDSHALQWWPALVSIARDHGWRLLSYTKSACTPIDALEWNSYLKRSYPECQTWTEHTLSRIAALRPDIVVVSSTRIGYIRPDGSRYSDSEGLEIYEQGMETTLRAIAHVSGHVVMLGDTPISQYDPPVCVSAHPSSLLACSTPTGTAIRWPWHDAIQTAALTAGVAYVDPTYWVCSSSPCPPVVGDFLVYSDYQHITPEFALALADRLAASLPGFPQLGRAISRDNGPRPLRTFVNLPRSIDLGLSVGAVSAGSRQLRGLP
jgi:peptidoglycan/LPS O-acetylase OafA/YrhL